MSSRPDPIVAGIGEPARPRWWGALTGPRARMIGIVGLSLINSALGLAFSISVENPSSPSELGWQTPSWLSITAVVVAPFLLLWRRRAPVLITVLAALAFLTSGLVFLPVGFALLTVAVQRRDLVLLACTTGVAATFWWSSSDSPEPWWFDVGLAVVLASFWALWGSYVGARRALLQSLRDRAQRAEEEQATRADQARQNERARIAREMHDVVAHKVSLIALQAGGLEVNAQLAPERVAGTAAQIRVTAREALEDLRGVLGVLRAGEDGGPGVELLPQPGLDDLATLVDRSRAAGVAVTLQWQPDEAAPVATGRGGMEPDVGVPVGGGGRSSAGEPPDPWRTPSPPVAAVAPAAGRTAYRLVQEALTNVTKHARGAATTVTVQRRRCDPEVAGLVDGPVLIVSVVNRRPVAAGSLLPGSGAGLIGLRERVELVGGALQVGPTLEGGWSVRAVLPISGGEPGSATAVSTATTVGVIDAPGPVAARSAAVPRSPA